MNEEQTRFLYEVGDFLERKIDDRMERSGISVPVIGKKAKKMTWYKVPVEDGMSGDGSEYHVYLKKGRSKNLCIFFSGGGLAWDEYTAARPVTAGKMAAHMPNFYWSNLRPVTQFMNINIGITENKSRRNPFDAWNFLIISYSTGDLHVGDSELIYRAEDGTENVLHFHGYKNFRAAMDICAWFFEKPSRILIAGCSAGAFAVPALAGEIADDFYPDVDDITLFSDSGQFIFDKWRETVFEKWNCPKHIGDAVCTDNITVDWYRNLHARYGSRFRYLYASSVHDYLLSAYYNETVSGHYESNEHVREVFFAQLRIMIEELMDIEPEYGFFINNWKNLLLSRGGTIHTAVREPYFYLHHKEGKSMAEWLHDAVNGNIYSVGLDLLGLQRSASKPGANPF